MNRDDILTEMREVEKDLSAFWQARSAINHRVHEMEGTARQETFLSWAATQVILNALIIATVRCEGLIEDYRKALEVIDVPNVLKLVPTKETNNA